MAFDFTSAINAALNTTGGGDNKANEPKSYRYPLVYPQAGSTLTVRILFNPKSNLITRLVQRHEKTACLRTYGKTKEECPICKMQEDVKNATGMDPFGRTSASKSRGIAFAQFINSTVQIKKGNDGIVNPGDNILFMFPWSVYQSINQMIQAVAQSPTGMDQAFCHSNSGLYIQVNVTSDFKYTAVQVPFMTFSNGMNDEQFLQMLEDMDSLNDQVLPATITEDVMKEVNEYAANIYKQYIEPKTTPQNQVVANNAVPQQFVNIAPTPVTPTVTQAIPQIPFNNPTITIAPVTPSVTQAVPQQTTVVQNTSVPACFGQHNAGDVKCICCPVEVQCTSKTV